MPTELPATFHPTRRTPMQPAAPRQRALPADDRGFTAAERMDPRCGPRLRYVRMWSLDEP